MADRDPRIDPAIGDAVRVPDRLTKQRWDISVTGLRDGIVEVAIEEWPRRRRGCFGYDWTIERWRSRTAGGEVVDGS